MSAGIPASELSDADLERELQHVHEKRHDVFLTGSADQLANNISRMLELEAAFLDRFGDRVADAENKVQALQAGPGQRAVRGSSTQPLARGQHTKHGWDADLPDSAKAGSGQSSSGQGGSSDAEGSYAAGASAGMSAAAGEPAAQEDVSAHGEDGRESAEHEQRHPDADERSGAREPGSVADEQDDAEAMEQGGRA